MPAPPHGGVPSEPIFRDDEELSKRHHGSVAHQPTYADRRKAPVCEAEDGDISIVVEAV